MKWRYELDLLLEGAERQNFPQCLEAEELSLFARVPREAVYRAVEGGRFRKVDLPEGSPRGGILTQGTMLVVTSNPTRTSPVKRGLFVLDNILGTPAPPPPGPVPELEDSAAKFEGRHPTLRELLEVHREDPLCHSCHARMDPLGLALENFNALGIWRDTDQGQPIDTAGQLITGFLGEVVDWHLGFGAAGVGMLAGLLIYWLTARKTLGPIGMEPSRHPDPAVDAKQQRTVKLALGGFLALVVIVFAMAATGVFTIDAQIVGRYMTGLMIGMAAVFFGYVRANSWALPRPI